MDATHLQLTIEKDGITTRTHHFLVTELGEIAEYIRNAVAQFFQDNPEASPTESALTLTLAKGELPHA
jgi:hypothetical protein